MKIIKKWARNEVKLLSTQPDGFSASSKNWRVEKATCWSKGGLEQGKKKSCSSDNFGLEDILGNMRKQRKGGERLH